MLAPPLFSSGLFSLQGKVAVVTGGSRGLGKEIASALGAAGARLTITARREQWLGPTATELRAAGYECLAATCDVSDANQVEAFVARVLEHYGRIDILFNNAGISWAAPSAEIPLQKWRDVMEVNATGTFIMSQAVGRHMIARAERNEATSALAGAADRPIGACIGKIVNVSSIMGLRGLPPDVLSAAPYSASKGALVALTRALAVEWAGYGITVNALAPGFFPTRLSEGVIGQHEAALLSRIPLGRLGSDRDLHGVAVFLAAPASDYITGQVISLDGGATAL
ncbi:MAG: SDR family oxidoreductase [Chloroflexota bacterium]|nr:SDR family oxidoreductase [Chloroflexota bacterium]